MSDLFGGIIAAGIAGITAWAAGKHFSPKRGQGQGANVQPASAPQRSPGGLHIDAGRLLDGLFSIASAQGHQQATQRASTVIARPNSTEGSLRPLLDLIARGESSGDYNKIWGGIRRADRPRRALTSMTVGEVLAWQDSIDHKYNSEAAGRYQMMEDTLRPLVGRVVASNDLFDEATQDKLAVHLMKRRGLDDYRAGRITAEQFADKLAREWAAIGVQRRQRGGSRTVNRGQSFYAGDGLNAASIRPQEMIAAIARIA